MYYTFYKLYLVFFCFYRRLHSSYDVARRSVEMLRTVVSNTKFKHARLVDKFMQSICIVCYFLHRELMDVIKLIGKQMSLAHPSGMLLCSLAT